MKINKYVLILILSSVISFAQNEYINNDSIRWKEFYLDTVPTVTVTKWMLPFKTTNRNDIKTLAVVSTFGSSRSSYIKGHKHTGLDCNPRPYTEPVDIYSMAEGIVCSVHLADPFLTVVIRHKLKDGSTLFTSYKHLGEVYVKNGDYVSHNTKLARVLTKAECKKFGGDYHHLHLEIRKDFSDYGCASWATLTKSELDLRFIDPLDFIKTNTKK